MVVLIGLMLGALLDVILFIKLDLANQPTIISVGVGVVCGISGVLIAQALL